MDLKTWFEDVPLRTELATEEREQVLALTDQPGFRHLLGLLLAERQGYYTVLASIDVIDQPRAASVIQGRIIGVDAIRQTMLDLTPEQVPANEGAN